MMPDTVVIAVMALGVAMLCRALSAHDTRVPPLGAVILVLLTGCTDPNRAARTALDVTGRTVDAVVPVLVAQMRREGLTEIEASLTREEAIVRVQRVRRKWAPVWGAIDAFERIHSAAVDLVEKGGQLTLLHLYELVAAYCDAREHAKVVEQDWPEPPLIGCEEPAK